MCEILIRAHDKTNADPYLDCKCFKALDVIVVVSDGWPWSTEELTNPMWRIVQLPNVSVATAEAFLAAEVDVNPSSPSRMLRRRGYYLDTTKFSTPIQNWWADDTRSTPYKSTNISESTLLGMKVQKTPLTDPNVIG